MPKITKRFVDSLEVDPDRDRYFWDDEVTGFGLRVKPSGVTSYMIQYRTPDGVSRRFTLGKQGVLTPDDARKFAKEKLAEVTKGGDPASEKKSLRSGMTVAELCDRYVRACETGERTGRNGRLVKASTLAMDKSRIETHVKPLLGKRKVASLTRGDLAKMQSDIASGKSARPTKETDTEKKRGRGGLPAGGTGVAARTLGMVGTILEFARREDLIEVNPARGVEKFAGNKVERSLSPDELKALGVAMRDALVNHHASETAIATILTLLLTGCRRLEILGLQWSQVDAENSCLRFDVREVGIKGGALRPLGKSALAVIQRQPRNKDCPWVFPGEGAKGHFVGAPKILERLCAKANIEDVTLHVLRHTFASVAAGMIISEFTIARMLGHSVPGVTARYVHVLDEALISAADSVSAHIMALLEIPSTAARQRQTNREVIPPRLPEVIVKPQPFIMPQTLASSVATVNDDFPARLRTARQKRGWPTHILARKAGTFPSMVETIEAGKFDPMNELIADIAIDLAKVLEIAPLRIPR